MSHRLTRPCVLALLLAPGLAFADDLDADTFSLSGGALDAQGTLQLTAPELGDPRAFYAGLGLVYSHQPVVYRLDAGGRDVIVDGQFSTRLAAGYNINGLARLDIELPIFPWVSIGGESQAAVGETRIGAVVPILRHDGDGVGFGVSPFLLLPTATKGAWLSNDGSAGGGLTAAAGGKAGKLGWAANLGIGFTGAAEEAGTTTGSGLTAGAGAHYGFTDNVLVGLEANTLLDLAGKGGWNEDPTEAHLYATYGGTSGFTATLGAGTGLVAGVGAPAFRTLLVLGYRDPGAPFVKDQDKDGIPDDHDACIDQPEDMDRFEDENGCPDPDNDHDGIPDIGDTCPDDPEDIDGYADGDGCADPDNDQDGVLDGDDQCPTENGLAEMHGCPDDDRDGLVNAQDECPSDKGPVELGGCPDRDNDRVPDKRDKCPDEPADSRIDPKRSDGCPAAIFITPTEIHIPEIYFDTNKSTIQSRSFDLVHQIAEVLKANPDLRLIEIAGHTDSTGNDASNLKLSQGRADAVRSRLVTIEGIDASRLVAVGYGETQPIESNRTPEGRAMNRRVEFRIKDPPPQ